MMNFYTVNESSEHKYNNKFPIETNETNESNWAEISIKNNRKIF